MKKPLLLLLLIPNLVMGVTYKIEGPDGKTYSLEGPEGATREEIIQEIQKQKHQQVKPPSYSIRTKDGIQINKIPGNILQDADVLKERVEKARQERARQESIDSKNGNCKFPDGKIFVIPSTYLDVQKRKEALKECNDHLNSGAVEALTGYQKESIVGSCMEQYGYYWDILN